MSVPGPVALHGGGEFEPGDEPFLDALLTAAAPLVGDGEPIRVAVVPTAASLGRPDLLGRPRGRGVRARRAAVPVDRSGSSP